MFLKRVGVNSDATLFRTPSTARRCRRLRAATKLQAGARKRTSMKAYRQVILSTKVLQGRARGLSPRPRLEPSPHLVAGGFYSSTKVVVVIVEAIQLQRK